MSRPITCILCKVLGASGPVEVQTVEEAKSLSKCDRKPVMDLQMLASRNLAVNRNINQFRQRLMRGHGAAKMRHTYTLVWRTYKYTYYRIQFIVPFRVPVS